MYMRLGLSQQRKNVDEGCMRAVCWGTQDEVTEAWRKVRSYGRDM